MSAGGQKRSQFYSRMIRFVGNIGMLFTAVAGNSEDGRDILRSQSSADGGSKNTSTDSQFQIAEPDERPIIFV